MTSDDEKFFAWLDGELSEAEAAEMTAKVAADPQLARLAEQHRALRSRLTDAFASVSDAPVPERLLEPLRETRGKVVDIDSAKRRRERRALPAVPQWAAVAATLVLGLFLGTLLPRPDASPVEVSGSGVYAAAGLEQALDTQLASAPAGDGVRIGLTFRDQAGSICRSFTGPEAAGLACRDGDRWRLRGLFDAPEGQSGDYRMAAGMEPGLAAVVDATMAGEPLDAAEERAARQRGWK